MKSFTGDSALRALFDGDALVIRDEESKGHVIVDARHVIDFLAFLQAEVAG